MRFAPAHTRPVCGATVAARDDYMFSCGMPRGHAGDHLPAQRKCKWCDEPMPLRARRDAETCSRACRQARQRFRVDAAAPATGDPMRFGFADPPYPGLSKKYYGHREVDHQQLLLRLIREFPHGWVLCTSSDALQDLMRMCPLGVRVGAWIKGSRPGITYKARSSWEPVIVWGGRPNKLGPTDKLDDSLVLHIGGRQRAHPGALVGMKPAGFCEWAFRQLGARQGDELVDLFPGSGAVSRAWRMFTGAEAVVRRRATSRLAESYA